MLLLCRLESLSNISGSTPFSVTGHSFYLDISGKLFVRNYQKKVIYIWVLTLLKSLLKEFFHGFSTKQYGQSRHLNIQGSSFLHFPEEEKKQATSAIPVRHNKHHSNNVSMPFLYPSSPQGTAHNNIPPPPFTSHSLLRDGTPKKVNKQISQFEISWVKSKTCPF